MSKRKTLLATHETYHVFNRSIAHQPIFTNSHDTTRFLNVLDFYRFEKPKIRYSHYTRLNIEQKERFRKNLQHSSPPIVAITAFAIMPNHFHFLITQQKHDGIKNFLSQIQNSYAKYYNTKHKREGSLFQEMFKAVRIETDEQFIHVARYIHLNPVTSYILKNQEELERYPLTSFSSYLNNANHSFLSKNHLMQYFKNTNKLKEFTFDQVNYQRELSHIKHLTLEYK